MDICLKPTDAHEGQQAPQSNGTAAPAHSLPGEKPLSPDLSASLGPDFQSHFHLHQRTISDRRLCGGFTLLCMIERWIKWPLLLVSPSFWQRMKITREAPQLFQAPAKTGDTLHLGRGGRPFTDGASTTWPGRRLEKQTWMEDGM